ncbi:MAG: hypothetical protein ACFFAZ_10645 [Promethearchaeota archaeon]
MTNGGALTIDRDLDDVKAQVKRELDTIRNLMDTLEYRQKNPDWNAPFQLHRLRRSLRIHYLAYKIRNESPVPESIRNLEWELDEQSDLF